MTASPLVAIGVDTHLDTDHVAVITDAGKPLADTEFPTSQTTFPATGRPASVQRGLQVIDDGAHA